MIKYTVSTHYWALDHYPIAAKTDAQARRAAKKFAKIQEWKEYCIHFYREEDGQSGYIDN